MAEKKEKRYVSDNAQLMAEWDWEKNIGLDPYSITWKSDKKVMWICTECGHSWETAIKNRSNGRGCPKCAKAKRLTAFNLNRIHCNGSLATEYPKVAMQWHPVKNGELSPYDVTSKSDKKVWWLCEKGHEWPAIIKNRSFHNKGCPYCAGQKVWTGFNDLATINPQLAREWHPTMNGTLLPQNVTVHYSKKVWWMCTEGHEWPATVDNRSGGTTCPYCSGRLSIPGKTDLATTHPEIAAEWHPTKNGNLYPSMVSHGSSKKVWWMCNKGHEWQAVISSRRTSGCPICAGEKRTSFPEQVIYFYTQKITSAYNRYMLNSKTEIDIYLPKLKIGIEYDGVFFHNDEEAHLREKRKELTASQYGITLLRVKETETAFAETLSENTIYCRPYPTFFELKSVVIQLITRINEISNNAFTVDVDIDRDRGNIYAQYVNSEKENSLQMMNPKLAAQWHPYRNETVSPLMVTANSNKKVWWQCSKCGHECQAVVASRNRGNGCPQCKRTTGSQNQVRSIVSDRGSLALRLPELAKEWHLTKNNDLYPTDVTISSGKKVWWQCSKCGHEWQAVVGSRSRGCGCPECARRKRR